MALFNMQPTTFVWRPVFESGGVQRATNDIYIAPPPLPRASSAPNPFAPPPPLPARLISANPPPPPPCASLASTPGQTLQK